MSTPDTAAPSGATSVSSDTIAEPITSNEIASLKRLDAEATQGPWRYEDDDEGSSMGWIVNSLGAVLFKVAGDSAQQAINAEHVVTMRAVFASLLASAEENARLRAALRIIAGEQQCADNLMGDKDIARAALGAPKTTDNGGCL